MKYQVVWSEFAESQLDEIYCYYSKNISIQIAKKLTNNILLATQKLEYTPRLGQKEPLLENRVQNYRYLIHTNYKIIYSINNEIVYIHDIFDTRQNPIKLNRNIM